MFISNAYAQGAGGAEGQLLGFLPIILMFVVLYFLMIRPQMKRAKEHRTMLGALQKGDEVITAGGVVGRINKVGEGYVTMEVAMQGDKPIEMHFQKASVQTLLPKGTIKAI
ncbi:MAG: preprotein translocase subunit YajC [Burkholderiaceae bacterium]|nr:preprotein translocase subunit YajC [Burkholderiaceae bacterium]